MIEFIERPISKGAISRRKLVYGVGINDANYASCYVIDGKHIYCPYYLRWRSMLARCYTEGSLSRNPTYIGCSVDEEWLLFSNFRLWMSKQDWHGKHLDKDILIQGNKIYSAKTCIFVTPEVNNLIINGAVRRGILPVGVSKCGDKFAAFCKKNGKNVNLGTYSTSVMAFNAYREFKLKVIKEVALKQEEPLRSALLRYEIKDDRKIKTT